MTYEDVVRAQAPIFFCGDETHDHHGTKLEAELCRAASEDYAVLMVDVPNGERKAFHGEAG